MHTHSPYIVHMFRCHYATLARMFKLGTVLCENGSGATLEPLFLVEGQFFVETGKTGSKLGTDTEPALKLLQWKWGNVVLARVSGGFF